MGRRKILWDAQKITGTGCMEKIHGAEVGKGKNSWGWGVDGHNILYHVTF